jgi:hypothetical protein
MRPRLIVHELGFKTPSRLTTPMAQMFLKIFWIQPAQLNGLSFMRTILLSTPF